MKLSTSSFPQSTHNEERKSCRSRWAVSVGERDSMNSSSLMYPLAKGGKIQPESVAPSAEREVTSRS